MRALGVLGGMFDPIHRGHLRAALAALNAGMDEVLLLPCQTPAHRPAALAPAPARLRMCALAAAAHPGLRADDTDLRAGACYAADTVRILKQKHPDAALHWIIGADKLPTLACWHDAPALFQQCDFLVCPRPGSDAFLPVPGARTRVIALEPLDLSSGLALAQLRGYDDAASALPPDVSQYIAENGLYQPDYEQELRARGMDARRLTHTLGVRREAVTLARRFGACMQKAAVAGMLHDIAKSLPLAQMRALAKRYDMRLPEELLSSENLLHGPLAAEIARRELGVAQPDILFAIACHTTGREDMTTLDLCLFVADAIEPSRADYPGLAQIRALAQTDLPAAALCAMRCTRAYVLSQGHAFCAQTERAMRSLMQKYPQL